MPLDALDSSESGQGRTNEANRARSAVDRILESDSEDAKIRPQPGRQQTRSSPFGSRTGPTATTSQKVRDILTSDTSADEYAGRRAMDSKAVRPSLVDLISVSRPKFPAVGDAPALSPPRGPLHRDRPRSPVLGKDKSPAVARRRRSPSSDSSDPIGARPLRAVPRAEPPQRMDLSLMQARRRLDKIRSELADDLADTSLGGDYRSGRNAGRISPAASPPRAYTSPARLSPSPGRLRDRPLVLEDPIVEQMRESIRRREVAERARELEWQARDRAIRAGADLPRGLPDYGRDAGMIDLERLRRERERRDMDELDREISDRARRAREADQEERDRWMRARSDRLMDERVERERADAEFAAVRARARGAWRHEEEVKREQLRVMERDRLRSERELADRRRLEDSERRAGMVPAVPMRSVLRERVAGDAGLIKRLDLSKSDIANIEFLEAFVSLEELHLDHNRIRALAGLPRTVRVLTMTDNMLTELAGLEELRSLESLDLSRNRIATLNGLDSNRSLQELVLSDNRIGAIQNVGHLRMLRALSLDGNLIAKLDGLSSLRQLERLRVSRNSIDALEDLPLPQLTELDLSENRIRTVNLAAPLRDLTRLSLAGNQLESLAGFGNFPAVTDLNVDDNNLRSFNGWWVLSNVRRLSAQRNAIGGGDPLGLPLLEELLLGGNRLQDLRWLQTCPSLRVLRLERNMVASLASSVTLAALEELDVAHNDLDAVDGIQAFPALTSLNLTANRIARTAPFAAAIGLVRRLRRLDVRGNAMTAAFYPNYAPPPASVAAAAQGEMFSSIEHYDKAFAIALDDKTFVDRLYYRSYLVHYFPELELLDSITVSHSERHLASSLADKFAVFFARQGGAPASPARATSPARSRSRAGSPEREVEIVRPGEPVLPTPRDPTPRVVSEAGESEPLRGPRLDEQSADALRDMWMHETRVTYEPNRRDPTRIQFASAREEGDAGADSAREPSVPVSTGDPALDQLRQRYDKLLSDQLSRMPALSAPDDDSPLALRTVLTGRPAAGPAPAGVSTEGLGAAHVERLREQKARLRERFQEMLLREAARFPSSTARRMLFDMVFDKVEDGDGRGAPHDEVDARRLAELGRVKSPDLSLAALDYMGVRGGVWRRREPLVRPAWVGESGDDLRPQERRRSRDRDDADHHSRGGGRQRARSEERPRDRRRSADEGRDRGSGKNRHERERRDDKGERRRSDDAGRHKDREREERREPSGHAASPAREDRAPYPRGYGEGVRVESAQERERHYRSPPRRDADGGAEASRGVAFWVPYAGSPPREQADPQDRSPERVNKRFMEGFPTSYSSEDQNRRGLTERMQRRHEERHSSSPSAHSRSHSVATDSDANSARGGRRDRRSDGSKRRKSPKGSESDATSTSTSARGGRPRKKQSGKSGRRRAPDPPNQRKRGSSTGAPAIPPRRGTDGDAAAEALLPNVPVWNTTRPPAVASLIKHARIPPVPSTVQDSGTQLQDLASTDPEFIACTELMAAQRGSRRYSCTRVLKVYSHQQQAWFSSLDGFLNSDGVNVLLAFHGASPETLTQLCTSGFTLYREPLDLLFGYSVRIGERFLPQRKLDAAEGTWRVMVSLIKLGKCATMDVSFDEFVRTRSSEVERLRQQGCCSLVFPPGEGDDDKLFLMLSPNRCLVSYLIEYRYSS